jgi:flagellar basal-body rod protein FlgB
LGCDPRARPQHQETRHVNERLFGIHGAALTLRSERMGVIASNIANAATPGYKARDIDFNAALDARLDATANQVFDLLSQVHQYDSMSSEAFAIELVDLEKRLGGRDLQLETLG